MVAFLIGAILGQGSMFAKIVPSPTGMNGYEEYLRAADIANTPDFKAYGLWLQSRDTAYAPPQDVDPKDPDLVVRRKWADRFRACCSLIARGNQKPVFDPRGEFTPETTFPEFSQFRQVIRLEAATAHVDFADGQTGSGVRHVEDSIVFAGKIGGSLLIGRLVGMACDSLAFNELDDHWAQLSLTDAQELEAFFGQRLGGPSPLAETVESERKLGQLLIERMFSKPEDLAREVGSEDDQVALAAAIAKLDPGAMQQVRAASAASIDAYYATVASALTGPEPGWLTFKDPPDASQADDSVQGLAARLVELQRVNMSHIFVREAADRTRMRLAYLTAKAVEFRWLNGRLPTRIEEFSTLAERTDATSGRAFQYKRDGPWFKVTRDNKDALGGVGIFTASVPDPNAAPIRP